MTLEEFLLSAAISDETITTEQALNIPTVVACKEMISKTIAMLPIKLYSETDGKVTELKDNRVDLLNDDTGDTLDGYQFKKAMVVDYLIEGKGYAYINRQRNNIKSLHYIESKYISIVTNLDPIFKSHVIRINAEPYKDYQFINYKVH